MLSIPHEMRAKRWQRRELLAAPGLLLLPSCAPDQGGVGAGLATPGSPPSGGAPTVEQAWSLVPEAVRRVLAEHPAFASAPAPSLSHVMLRDNTVAELWAEQTIGRIGSATSSVRRFRSRDDLSAPSAITLGRGGIWQVLLWGQQVDHDQDRVEGRQRIRFRQPAPPQRYSLVIIDILSIEGSLFPLRIGNRLTMRSRTARISPELTVVDPGIGIAPVEDTAEVVKSWTPRAFWLALLQNDFQLQMPKAYCREPHALHGEFHQLTWGRGFTLYSILLGLQFAQTEQGSVEGIPVADRPLRFRAFSVFTGQEFPHTPLLPGERVVLSPEGDARLAEARAALRAEQDAAALRSSRLNATERARAGDLFRIAFQLWQAGNNAAAMTGFLQGLDVDPGNGIAHYYVANSADRLYSRIESPVHQAALSRFRSYHMEAAARFAPATREGIEAQTFMRQNPI